MELAPGVIVANHYRLESLLGAGGMGAVWRATDVLLGRTVALKVLHTDLGADPALRERFQREARLLASVEHPAIVPIYALETIEDDEGRTRPCIVMPLVKGRPLGDAIRQSGAFKLEYAVAVLRSLLEALAVAHAAGIVHRDLKPQNVILEDRGGTAQVRLLDFGIAKSVAAPVSKASALATQLGTLLGTPEYMSPEQIANSSGVDARADLWAAAVCFYEMLTGHVPFSAPTPVETVARVLSYTLVPVTQYAPALPLQAQEFLARALARDLERRPRDAAEMLRMLEPLAAGRARTQPIEWPPPALTHPPGALVGFAAPAPALPQSPPYNNNGPYAPQYPLQYAPPYGSGFGALPAAPAPLVAPSQPGAPHAGLAVAKSLALGTIVAIVGACVLGVVTVAVVLSQC